MMINIGRRFAILFFAGWAAYAGAEPVVTSLDLVSTERVGRTLYEYTYRIRVENDLPGLNAAIATVSSTNPATSIVDDQVLLGDLTIGTTTSIDTFTLRHDRSVPFDPDALAWDFMAKIRIAIGGQVRDGVISDAAVILSVEGTGLMSVSTTADSSGIYLESVEGTGLQDFVSIEAEGVGDQDFVMLNAHLGSMGTLLSEGNPGGRTRRGGAGSVVVGGRDVTHITTARRVLAEEAAGGEISTQAALDAATAMVDTAKIIRVAATIKTVVDNAHIGLPAGITDTLELARSPQRSAFADFLETAFPEEFAAAVAATAAETGAAGFDPASLPPVLYVNLAGVQVFTPSATRLELGPDGVGTFTGASGSTSTNYVVTAGRELQIDLDPPLLQFEYFTTIPSAGEVRVHSLLDRVVYQKTGEDAGISRAQEILTTRITYPDHPEIPDEVTVSERGSATARRLYGPDQIIAFVAEELTASPVALSFLHSDLAVPRATSLLSEFGFDFFEFATDGSGSTRRSGLPFTWSIDALGRLDLSFANGDVTQWIKLTPEAPGVASGAMIGTLAGTAPLGRRSFAIVEDSSLSFDAATLSNRRLRVAWAGRSFAPRVSDFTFFPGSSACRSPDSFSLRDFDWTLLSDRVDIKGDLYSGEQASLRSLEPVRRSGDDTYWVIETNELFPPVPPGFRDPATTPGRPSAYILQQDLSGNTRPTIRNDRLATGTGTALEIYPGTLFGNDSDPEDDELRIADYDRRTSAGGVITATMNVYNELVGLRYTPPGEFTGLDTFDYVATDTYCQPRRDNDTMVAVNSRGSYLRAEPFDEPGAPTIIDLATLGFSGGDTIRLEHLGDFRFATDSEIEDGFGLTGVFSASSTLGTASVPNRVVDAIDAGNDIETRNDIAEDFLINGVTLKIPGGAKFLFVAAWDHFFADNSDLDEDLALGVSAPGAGVGTVTVEVGTPSTRPVWRKPVRPDPQPRRPPVRKRN